MRRQALFTIAPHAPFLPTLVERICDGTLTGGIIPTPPFGLADISVFVPSQRVRQALITAFADRLDGGGLLPDIRPLGDADPEEAAFLDTDWPLPPATHPSLRQLTLARLVGRWVEVNPSGFANPPSAAEIISLAGSLGQLVDRLHIEEIDPSVFAGLVPEDRDVAVHWQETLAFLSIALTAWPKHLEDIGGADHAALRRRIVDNEAETALQRFGERPVIAAGSTGSMPATARLLAAIADLPNGVVVLPGLDTDLGPDDHAALLHKQANPETNSQYALMRLLRVFDSGPGAVEELADTIAPRTTIVRQALARAEMSGAWSGWRAAHGDEAIAKAFESVALVAAPTQHDEARAIAVAVREALHEDRGRIGIITPDRDLARRIARELERFGIEIDDSAGIPLSQSGAGRLVRQMLALAGSNCGPVELVGLLGAAPVTLGFDRKALDRLRRSLDKGVLRGRRVPPGLDGLTRLISDNAANKLERVAETFDEATAEQLTELVARLDAALSPLLDVFAEHRPHLPALARALGKALDVLRAPAEGAARSPLDGGPELAALIERLSVGEDGFTATAPALGEAFITLMGAEKVHPPAPARRDVSLWGRIEARLMNADLMILAGLNEGAWPDDADPGPWLSRGMQVDAGLEPPEFRIGQAAHDFEMALGNRNAILTHAVRVGTSPADPSRFLKRLTAFLGEDVSNAMQERGARWLDFAARLDDAGAPVPAKRPAPCPPAALRPRRLSVTEIEPLIRDPYEIYAKRVLRLTKLPGLGEVIDAAERGTLIHGILGDFIARGHDPTAPDAQVILNRLAEEHFEALNDVPAQRDIWLRRFSAIGAAWLGWERARAGYVDLRFAEKKGETELPVAGVGFTLYGRADRIDRMKDGRIEILDFKTGSIPDKKTMAGYLAPQLPIEALIARRGGFDAQLTGAPARLAFLKLAHGPVPLAVTELATDGQPLDKIVDDYWHLLQAHIAHFLFSDTTPMIAGLMPDTKARYVRDYAHLARVREWGGTEGEDE